jgi:hypothetical protein
MGGLTHGAAWWWKYFKELYTDLSLTVKGHINLGYGMHSLTIPIDPNIKPRAVFVNCYDNGVSVCVGNISMATAKLNNNHTFTLIANIQSNSCMVGWLIEYKPFFE